MIRISKADASKIRKQFTKLYFIINTTPSFSYLPESVDFKAIAEQKYQNIKMEIAELTKFTSDFNVVNKCKKEIEVKFGGIENQNKIDGLKQLIWALENTHPYYADILKLQNILKSLRYSLRCLEQPNYKKNKY